MGSFNDIFLQYQHQINQSDPFQNSFKNILNKVTSNLKVAFKELQKQFGQMVECSFKN